MSKHKQPAWRSMFLIGFAGIGVLFIEPQMPVGATPHTLVLLVWVIGFYGALAIWIRANREALERGPRPRDFAGRLIIDVDAPECQAQTQTKPESPVAHLPVAYPPGQSEVI